MLSRPAVSLDAAVSEAVRVRGLGVRFGRAEILRDISFDVVPGEVIGVVGPNGAGKSTLLRVLAGLVRYSGGEAALKGRPVETLSPSALARFVAFMPQGTDPQPFSALETVLMGRYPHLGRFQLEGPRDRDIALRAMASTETDAFRDRHLNTLSGGERQRVLMARVLAQEGSIMLLDEPTANLDLRHRLGIMDLIREQAVARDAAVIVALHDLSLATRYCDRLLLLADGRLLAAGSPDAVLTVDNIRSAFGVESLVEPDPATGRPLVVVLGAAGQTVAAGGAEDAAVHLVCGAGSGRGLMYALFTAGFRVTAGVLGEGDTDREAADRLGLRYVPIPPFSAIDDDAHGRHLALIEAADYVVVCDMPVGRGNIRNLEAARSARSLLMLKGRPFEERDHAGGGAADAYAALADRALEIDRTELLEALVRGGPAAQRGS